MPGATGSVDIRRKEKLWIEDQRKFGYKNNIRFLVDQASHEHVDNNELAWDVRYPLEIWYVATIKRPGDRSAPFYCVAPRVENPSVSAWSRPFLVTLAQDERDNTRPLLSKQVDAVPAGGSSEVFSHCEKRDRPPSWIIETPHGKAKVIFPKN